MVLLGNILTVKIGWERCYKTDILGGENGHLEVGSRNSEVGKRCFRIPTSHFPLPNSITLSPRGAPHIVSETNLKSSEYS